MQYPEFTKNRKVSNHNCSWFQRKMGARGPSSTCKSSTLQKKKYLATEVICHWVSDQPKLAVIPLPPSVEDSLLHPVLCLKSYEKVKTSQSCFPVLVSIMVQSQPHLLWDLQSRQEWQLSMNRSTFAQFTNMHRTLKSFEIQSEAACYS